MSRQIGQHTSDQSLKGACEYAVGGSGAGAKAAIAGEISLAFLSRELNDKEKQEGLIGHAYAKDGVAVIVNKINPVTGLTAR